MTLLTVIGPDVVAVSEHAGHNQSAWTMTPDIDLTEWQARAVPAVDSLHTEGYLVDSGGAVTGGDDVAVTITGTELKAAVGVDGDYIIRFFGLGITDDWSDD